VDQKLFSERKLRLFACACFRRVLLQDSDGARWLVETAETVADGVVTAACTMTRCAGVRLHYPLITATFP
jgi:hypothetical protein